jgi:hypothetical protein
VELKDENVDDILNRLNLDKKKKIRKNRLNRHRLYKYNKELLILLTQIHNMNNIRFATLNCKMDTLIESLKNDRQSFRQFMNIQGISVQEEIQEIPSPVEIPENISFNSTDILRYRE